MAKINFKIERPIINKLNILTKSTPLKITPKTTTTLNVSKLNINSLNINKSTNIIGTGLNANGLNANGLDNISKLEHSHDITPIISTNKAIMKLKPNKVSIKFGKYDYDNDENYKRYYNVVRSRDIAIELCKIDDMINDNKYWEDNKKIIHKNIFNDALGYSKSALISYKNMLLLMNAQISSFG